MTAPRKRKRRPTIRLSVEGVEAVCKAEFDEQNGRGAWSDLHKTTKVGWRKMAKFMLRAYFRTVKGSKP